MQKPLIEREERASAWMQTRLLDLLLRYDKALFDSYFNERKALASSHPELRRYRDVAVLLRLRDELFDYILPQIVRRLSFDAPRSTQIEEHPVSGQIDWEQTLSASWESFPDKPPLQLYTRQNRRSFATPENLLTVLTLLEYKRNIDQMLRSSDPFMQGQQLRSQLLTIAEQCERELSFPQFMGLREDAQKLLDQQHDSELVERLELLVSEHLLPGANNAYHELLVWREKLRKLEMVRLYSRGEVLTLGPDLEQQSRLYQIWVLYELLEFLSLEERVLEHQSDQSEAQRGLLRFRWGSPETLSEYELLFNPELASQWQGDLFAQPTFLLRRCDRNELRDGDELIWHEPGFLLDAVYQPAASASKLLDNARKRLIGELQVSGEQRALVLVPFVSQEHDQLTQGYPSETRLSNRSGDLQIEIRQLSPLFEWRSAGNGQAPSLQKALRELLEHLHQAMQQRVALECHGTIADLDTINPHARAVPRCSRCNNIMAFCPKPHISREKVDLVCPKCDCLSNRRICHIIDLKGIQIPPYVQRVLTKEDLQKNIEELKDWLRKTLQEDDQSDEAERLRTQVLEAISDQVTNYIKLNRVDLSHFEGTFKQWVFGDYWDRHERHLCQEAREMLVAGEYIWHEVKDVQFDDWAACAVQYLRAVEIEVHRRFFGMSGNKLRRYSLHQTMNAKDFTFGTPSGTAFNKREDRPPHFSKTNWEVLCQQVAEPNSLSVSYLEELCKGQLNELAKLRNKVAHTESITRATAEEIRTKVLGERNQVGALVELCTNFQVPPNTTSYKPSQYRFQ